MIILCRTPDTRGTILSLFSTLFRASQTVAPVIGGLLFLAGGYDLLFVCAMVMACILGMPCRATFRRAEALQS